MGASAGNCLDFVLQAFRALPTSEEMFDLAVDCAVHEGGEHDMEEVIDGLLKAAVALACREDDPDLTPPLADEERLTGEEGEAFFLGIYRKVWGRAVGREVGEDEWVGDWPDSLAYKGYYPKSFLRRVAVLLAQREVVRIRQFSEYCASRKEKEEERAND